MAIKSLFVIEQVIFIGSLAFVAFLVQRQQALLNFQARPSALQDPKQATCFFRRFLQSYLADKMCRKLFIFKANDGAFGANSLDVKKVPGENAPMHAYLRHIHDAILFVPVCVHNMILLRQFRKSLYFLPYFPLRLRESWLDQILYYLEAMLKNCDGFNTEDVDFNYRLIRFSQIQLPRYCEFLHQLAVLVEIEPCKDLHCNKGTGPFRWFPTSKLTENSHFVWGADLCGYLTNVTRCSELSINQDLKTSHKRWAMIQSVITSEQELICLYSEFLQHGFPSHTWNQNVFLNYMKRSKIELIVKSQVHSPKRLYQAFCLSNGFYISFKDFVSVMVALDRHCMHGGVGGEIRTRCIFRYHAKDIGAQALSFSELVCLFGDIALVNRKPEEESPLAEVTKLYKRLKLDHGQSLSIEKFIDLVGSLGIRGTSSLFRSIAPLQEVQNKQYYQPLSAQLVSRNYLMEDKLDTFMPKTSKSLSMSLNKSIKHCRQCMPQIYKLGPSCALNGAGELIRNWEDASNIEKASQTKLTVICTKLRDVLRRFAHLSFGYPFSLVQDAQVPKWEKKEDRTTLLPQILELFKGARVYFGKCPRIIKCTSPLYCFGDIHGNLKDLLLYDQMFWSQYPNGYVCPTLFMGDYVDRGDYSLECAIYLICMKMLLPDRVHILRGNHELRPVQQQFTFHRECYTKFGPASPSVFEGLNDVFDCMPPCALINEQIYCAHGGIPASAIRLESCYRIPNDIPNPMECHCAWEILWNDPVGREEYSMFLARRTRHQCFPVEPLGFTPNLKRGTAYYYSEEAVEYFFEHNNIAAILRAHECIPLGFLCAMSGKVTTMFSCSHYCGQDNKASVMYVDGNGEMRPIQIETDLP